MMRLLLFLVATLSSSSVVAQSPLGLQTHFGSETYAGGMAYSKTADILYVTGQVGGNSCFVGLIKPANMQFISKQIFSEPAICQGVALTQQETTPLFLATTEEGGLFTDTRVPGSNKATQYGILTPLQFTEGTGQSSRLGPGLLLHEDAVQYPRSMVVDPFHAGYVYVASMHSTDKSLSDEFEASDTKTPNLTPAGIKKYGSAYGLMLERIRFNELDHTLDPSWRKIYAVSSFQSPRPSVVVNQMLWNKGALVVAGATKGSGTVFGEGGASQNYFNGFATKFDPNNGNLWDQGGANMTNVYRAGADTAHTYLQALCSGDSDADELYLVGMTENNSIGQTLSPFLTKANAMSMQEVWTIELPSADADSYGLACAVDAARNFVYMAGVVRNGGSLEGSQSLGNDDLFLAQFDMATGNQLWIKQFGTNETDNLARGGNGLAVTDDGVILFGDTAGSFYSSREQASEIMILSVDTTGNMPPTLASGASANSVGSVAATQPDVVRPDSASDGGGLSPTKAPTGPSATPPKPIPSPTKEGGPPFTGTGVAIMVAVLAFVLGFGYIMRSHQQREKVTERALVFSYLQAFDLEDVDVRHSATGGWHGTYVGKLAQGEGVARRSHSSIVKDSLFVDFDEAPKGKRQDDQEGTDGLEEGDDQDFDHVARLKGADSIEDDDSNDPWGSDII